MSLANKKFCANFTFQINKTLSDNHLLDGIQVNANKKVMLAFRGQNDARASRQMNKIVDSILLLKLSLLSDFTLEMTQIWIEKAE